MRSEPSPLRRAADAGDAVTQAAFNHDFADLKENSGRDRKIIAARGEALIGSDRPLVISSGTGPACSKDNRPVIETDDYVSPAEFPRAASEEAADAVIAKDGRVMVMQFSQLHDTRHQGRIAQHILLVRQKGWVAYIDAGTNRLPAVQVSDAVRLYRLALEKGRMGARYNAVDEAGFAPRDIRSITAHIRIRQERPSSRERPPGHRRALDCLQRSRRDTGGNQLRQKYLISGGT